MAMTAGDMRDTGGGLRAGSVCGGPVEIQECCTCKVGLIEKYSRVVVLRSSYEGVKGLGDL